MYYEALLNVLRFDSLKHRVFEILTFHPCFFNTFVDFLSKAKAL